MTEEEFTDQQSLKEQLIAAESGKLKLLQKADEKEKRRIAEIKEKKRVEKEKEAEKEKLDKFLEEKSKEDKEEEADASYGNALLLKAQKSLGSMEPVVQVLKHNKSEFLMSSYLKIKNPNLKIFLFP